MSEDNKPTKPAKEKVKEELTSTDDNKDSFDRGDAAAQEQQRILNRLKNNNPYFFYYLLFLELHIQLNMCRCFVVLHLRSIVIN